MTSHRRLVTIVGVWLTLTGTLATAESEVQPATHTVSTTLSDHMVGGVQPTGEVVRFAQQPALVGDRVAQTMGAELQLSASITQAGQTANESHNAFKRRQQRFVEVLEVVDGAVRRAHVTYPFARLNTSENDDSEQESVQPVEKHSYFVTRDGDRLLVTDAEGAIPPQDEFEIVVTSLQNFGLPNPLTKFLVSQAFRVGQRLQLPQEVAQQVMGFGGQFGEVKAFDLELKSVKEIEGQRCALFAASIEAVGEADSPVNIRAFGQVVIATETCRIVRAELSGPLALSVAENTPAGSFQYVANGSMRIEIASKYGHASK